MVAIIKNWAICYSSQDPYRAPEMVDRIVVGKVYNHEDSRFDDGDNIKTSEIVSVKGREFTTVSGSKYRLYGRPRPQYLTWLKDSGIEYNGKKPIKVK